MKKETKLATVVMVFGLLALIMMIMPFFLPRFSIGKPTRGEAAKILCEKYGHDWGEWVNWTLEKNRSDWGYLISFKHMNHIVNNCTPPTFPCHWDRKCKTCGAEEDKDSWSRLSPDVTEPMYIAAREAAKTSEQKLSEATKEINRTIRTLEDRIEKKADKPPEIAPWYYPIAINEIMPWYGYPYPITNEIMPWYSITNSVIVPYNSLDVTNVSITGIVGIATFGVVTVSNSTLPHRHSLWGGKVIEL